MNQQFILVESVFGDRIVNLNAIREIEPISGSQFVIHFINGNGISLLVNHSFESMKNFIPFITLQQ